MLKNAEQFAYPAILNLAGKKCIIIGGGAVAARKLRTLLAAGAEVTVLAPQFSEGLIAAAEGVAQCHLEKGLYTEGCLEGAFLVVAATNDAAVNRQITMDAPCLCNNITEPGLGNFIVPSAFKRGQIAVTLATGGLPAYTRLLKKFLERQLTPALADFGTFLLAQRESLQNKGGVPSAREAFWRMTLNDEILALLEKGETEQAKERISNAVHSFRP